MPVKLFISYSHKDEKFKENFEEHLATLKMKNIIESWNDREITAGSEWSNQIDENLRSADIIIFIVSSSFIASDYCQNIEVATAIEQHKSNKSVLVPVIVRRCDWMDLEFAKFQGLPKDANPISSWKDEDEAWLNVIDGLKRTIKDFTDSKKKVEKREIVSKKTFTDNTDSIISKSFLHWLDDTEVKFTHRHVGNVKFQNIFVPPDIQNVDNDTERLLDIESSQTILERSENYLIVGDEQIGKTSILKFFCIELLKKEVICIFLNAKDINPNFEKVLKTALKDEYNSVSFGDVSNKETVVLIDDFNQIKLSKTNIEKFISFLKGLDIRILSVCDSNFIYISDDIIEFDDFEKPKLLELGHQKREELIKKWISLGLDESISMEKECLRQTDLLKDSIDRILKKNIIPTKPIYLLMLLQMFEANKKLNIELTSFGHCYQELIYNSFSVGKIRKDEYDKYINVLTELSWWIFVNRKNPNYDEIDCFFENYKKNYISLDQKVIIDKLIHCALLASDNIEYRFKYPYIYYFFVGKKIAEYYEDSNDVKQKVEELLQNIHKEDCANILIFVTHHTKSNWILSKVEACLQEQYKNIPEAEFSKQQLNYIQKFITNIPNLVVEQREVYKEKRANRNQYLDKQDELQQEMMDEDSKEILSDINRVFKSMEVAGQIINNRHASLRKPKLVNLATNGIDAGLRFLNYFIDISDSAQDSIVRFIAENIADDPNISNENIKEYAKNSYLLLTYNVLYATIQKIAHSIGSKEANEIYQNIAQSKNTPAHILINFSISLQFNKTLNIQEIIKLNEMFSNNVVCLRLMKQLVIQHMYMYPLDYKLKQQVAEKLDIKIKKQRWLESESKKNALSFKNIKVK